MNPETSYAVNPGWALIMADAGISATNVLRRAGMPRDLFSSGVTSLSADQYHAIWVALDEETQDPELPLRIGRAISMEAFDAPIFAATCSPNLNVAARRLSHYKKLVGPMRLEVTQTPQETTLELVWPPDMNPPASLAHMDLVFWVALARLCTRAPIRPVRVTTPHPPAARDAYREYLGVTVRRGPTHSVVFSAEDARRPFLTANDGMWEFFEPELRKRLSELEANTSVAARVRASLLELLPAGDGSMDAVAHDLAMSTRTLQRRLKGEGTSFQSILNDTREALARYYLEHSDMPAGQISFLLGYEDPRSFYRAFQAWTGSTPQLVRSATLA